jgi:hypothetical protein
MLTTRPPKPSTTGVQNRSSQGGEHNPHQDLRFGGYEQPLRITAKGGHFVYRGITLLTVWAACAAKPHEDFITHHDRKNPSVGPHNEVGV